MRTKEYKKAQMNNRMDGCAKGCNAQQHRFLLENINMQ